MTTPPLHNTDASLDELFNMAINAKQVAVTTVTGEMDIWLENGEIAEQANVLLERYRAEFKQTVLSLLAEAEERGRAIGQYQAANNMYGDVTSLWMLRKNPPDLFTLESLLKTCEGTLNDNQDTYNAYLAALRQKESKDERSKL